MDLLNLATLVPGVTATLLSKMDLTFQKPCHTHLPPDPHFPDHALLQPHAKLPSFIALPAFFSMRPLLSSKPFPPFTGDIS